MARRGPRGLVSKEKAWEILTETKGTVSLAAGRLGVSRGVIYRLLEKHPDLKEHVDGFREELVDIAELALRKAVSNGESWAIKFALRSKMGRKRGYTIKDDPHPSISEPQKIVVAFEDKPESD